MKQDKIWEHFQNEQGESFDGARARLSWIHNKLIKGQRVLNIGVGNGAFERMSLQSGVDIFSLDPSERSIAQLIKELNLEEKAKVGYSQDIPFDDGFFDVVVMSEVLEHLSDEILRGTFVEIKRVLKNKGMFIGTVPARENLNDSVTVCPECACQFHRWGHVQSFNKISLNELFSIYFTRVNIEERLFVNWKMENWKGKIIYCLKKLLLVLDVHGSNENLYFEVVKD